MDRGPRSAAAVWQRKEAGNEAQDAAGGWRGRLHAVLLAAIVAAVAVLVAAASASAVIVHPQGTGPISYQPLRHAAARTLDAYFSNLDYNGGSIMPSSTEYAIYWQPAGAPAYPSDYQPGVNRYLEDLAHDSGSDHNVESVSAQYNDAANQLASYEMHFGGAFVDTQPYPANGCTKAKICLTDAQLQTELKRFTKEAGLPTDLTHMYLMLTPPGVESCFTAGGGECSAGSTVPVYCAYHSDAPLSTGGVIVYTEDPYVTGNEGCDEPSQHPNDASSDGIIMGGLSHEINEAITDPEPNSAWTDLGGEGGEIGDKCRTFEQGSEFGTPLGYAPDGSPYNQVINGHFYWYQQEWSNQTVQCLQRLSFVGEEPVATFTSTPGTGEEVHLNASGSTATGGVSRYSWQFNDGPGLASPVETTSPTVTHTFPSAGVYNVALTVFSGNGTSAGTAHTVVAGAPPLPVVKHVAPARGPASGGTTVTITGTGFSGATEVKFGTTTATFYVKSATSIVATAPAEAVATIDIHVTTPAGTSAVTTYDHYKYVPTITGVSPAKGPVAGGTVVKVSGSGFLTGTTATVFHFGGVKSKAVDCTSTTACTVTTPPHAAGTVETRATVASLSNIKEASDRFTYE